MQLPNPNNDKPFDRVIKDAQGNEIWGIRAEHSGDEEIVHIPTGKSNMSYWKPEMVLNPEGCEHIFYLYNVGRREIECSVCHLTTAFIPGVNYSEENGQAFVTLKGKKYPVLPVSL